MRNRLIILILILLKINIANSQDFVLESDSIEILEEGKITLAKNGVEINTTDGLNIKSNNSKYNKETSVITFTDEVIFYDKIKDLVIKSNYIEYNKGLEKVFSKGLTVIELNNNYVASGKDFIFLRNSQKINSTKKVQVTDNLNNKLETSMFDYSILDQTLRTKDLVFIDKDSNKYFSSDAIIDLTTNKIAGKDIAVYFNDKGMGKDPRLRQV